MHGTNSNLIQWVTIVTDGPRAIHAGNSFISLGLSLDWEVGLQEPSLEVQSYPKSWIGFGILP